MTTKTKAALAVVLLACLFVGLSADAGQTATRTKIRYALGDVITADDLQLLIAVERAKERGVWMWRSPRSRARTSRPRR